MEKTINLWMPITKSEDKFVGVLSDDSIDRDGEFMTKELLQDWANTKSLPALLNHENKMEKFIGAWKNFKTVEKDGRTALIAEPFFFKSSPLAQEMKKVVEEAVENGLNPGISIGAVPKDFIEKEIDGVKRKGFTKAELVEATLVPVQSNRNANFVAVAKSFDYNVQTSDPDKVQDLDKKKINDLEVNKMAEEEVKQEAPVEQPAEQPAEPAPEPKAEEAPAKEAPAENAEEKSFIAELKKEIAEFKALKEDMKKAYVRKTMDAEGEELKKGVDNSMPESKPIGLEKDEDPTVAKFIAISKGLKE